MWCFLSSGVNFPHFLGFPWKALISMFSLSSNALRPRHPGLDLRGPANMCQFLSRSLVAFTNVVMVSGCGDIWTIFWWSDWFKFFLNAYIWVCSSTLAHLACMLQSWYHSLNSLFPMGRLWIFWIDSTWVWGGMNCSLNLVLNYAQVPYVTGVAPRVVAKWWLAQSLAEVPILKCVRAAATFWPLLVYTILLRV